MALVGANETDGDVETCGFSSAIGPKQADDLSLFYFKGDLIDHSLFFVGLN